MTVQELINKLQAVEDKEMQITIAVHQYNKIYPVAYIAPFEALSVRVSDFGVRINASLPDNMITRVKA